MPKYISINLLLFSGSVPEMYDVTYVSICESSKYPEKSPAMPNFITACFKGEASELKMMLLIRCIARLSSTSSGLPIIVETAM